MPREPLPQYYTVSEVAESLCLVRRSIYNLIKRGDLEAVKTSRRRVLITAESYAGLIARGRTSKPTGTEG